MTNNAEKMREWRAEAAFAMALGKDLPPFPKLRTSIERQSGLEYRRQGAPRPGRPNIEDETEAAIRKELAKGTGINKTARLCGVGNGTVSRVKREISKPHRRPRKRG